MVSGLMRAFWIAALRAVCSGSRVHSTGTLRSAYLNPNRSHHAAYVVSDFLLILVFEREKTKRMSRSGYAALMAMNFCRSAVTNRPMVATMMQLRRVKSAVHRDGFDGRT